MRQLNKQCKPEIAKEFLGLFKKCFDRLVLDQNPEPSKQALGATLILFGKRHPIVLD